MFEKYIIDEISKAGPYLESEDISKFIIQSYTGPFHILREKPGKIETEKNIIEQYKANFKFSEEEEIYQQISDSIMRLHIVPFIKKYNSSKLLADIFLDNFKYIDRFTDMKIPEENVTDQLVNVGIIDTDSVLTLITKYNTSGKVPSHSSNYRNNLHPCYLVVFNDVIKDFIRLL